MRPFLAALVICAMITSMGCAGRRATETVSPIEITASVASECSRLASSGSNIPGWKLASPARTYDKESIFDYINGAAELYFAYDFRAVAAAEYQNGETSIIIDVYDMTAPENAFGIYSLNRYPEAHYVDVGNEGISLETNLDFWKGQYFCRVYSLGISEELQKDVVNFGGILALNIQEAGAEPPLLKSLPQNGLIPKTARFFSRKLGLDNIHYVAADNVLNLSSETRGVVAEYQIDDNSFQLFTIEYPSLDAVHLAFESYSGYLNGQAESLSDGLLRTFKNGDEIILIGVRDQILWGAWNVQTQEAAEVILRNISLSPVEGTGKS